MKYKVLYICDPDILEEYKKYNKYYEIDTKEHPKAIDYLEDEAGLFILDTETGKICDASEFFFMTNIREFEKLS